MRRLTLHRCVSLRGVPLLGLISAATAAIFGLAGPGEAAGNGPSCARTITANVVALDQPLMFNRLGAQNVNGMIYALRRDVVEKYSEKSEASGGSLTPGNVMLRPDKRPRPLVLRVAAGDCLTVNFQNLLADNANPNNALPNNVPPFNVPINDQVKGRFVGFHPAGLELTGGIASDASFVGDNPNSTVSPGGTATYTFYAPEEGAFLVSNPGATFGSEGAGGNIGNGLFGAVMVEPKRANFYRSQVTEEELRLATKGYTEYGQPIIDYEARYPGDRNARKGKPGVWKEEGKAGLPILNMLDGNELVHSDINAIIVGPNPDGSFPPDTYPLESVGKRNPTVPNRLEAFREFASIWHDETAAGQAFPAWFEDPVVSHTLHGVRDSFMINYGSGGIGSEIIANRLGVGPMHDCLDCAYEEFFLTSYTVGDPAMIVDVPANLGLEACNPALQNCVDVGPKATAAFYPADPANVHHSYQGDFTKFRNIHAGPKEQHIFHLHNHQWLFNPNDDNSNYLDAQGIGPGSGYTYEINNGGAGNRNKTVGDAIFHCHFYPHFAQGMWYMWRIHDVMETGTVLAVSNGEDGFHNGRFGLFDGTPAAGARALPDGEILAGTPIPAVVPLPGKPMPPMPGRVEVVTKDANGDGVAESSQANVLDRDINPGYPFWIAGIEDIVGQRPPTPPLDMLTEEQAAALGFNPLHAGGFDGGLPRHALEGYAAGGASVDTQNRFDFSKVVTVAKPVYYPEAGTELEKVAMDFHAKRAHPSTALNLDGTTAPGDYIVNGGPPVPGAPYNEPCIDDQGMVFDRPGQFFSADGFFTSPDPQYGADNPRVYKGANIQIDAVFNKVGYHYPQQRIIALWEDVQPTLDKVRPPEPFVMRLNTFDCAKFLHTNLIPEVFELDDYQVRTPTDIIGQHIHLPKWDLTTADGAANGWNYEDGTLSPGMVHERIEAIHAWNALAEGNQVTLDVEGNPVVNSAGEVLGVDIGELHELPHPFFGELGARTTIQRWFADPIINVQGVDRGLGIIFTHDHYGPSTVQQIGLYATVLVEPAGSQWVHNETGQRLGTRHDGGPTSWQAAILGGDYNLDGADDGDENSYREFYFEFGDFQHAYQKGVFVGVAADGHTVAPPDANTFRDAINPPYRQQANNGPLEPRVFPDIMRFPPVCPGGVERPCPEAISADDPGMLVINYRNEPVGLRVYDPNKLGPDGKRGTQADGLAGDLAFALQTRTDRAIPELNTALGDTPYPALTGGVLPGDPFTPLLRTYPGDKVRIKIQAGAHEHEHNFAMHGVKWLQAGSGFGQAPNSGWRSSQNDGISEQFSLAVPFNNSIDAEDGIDGEDWTDYAYTVDASQDGWWSGIWGILRSYEDLQSDLRPLPNNRNPERDRVENKGDFVGVCPVSAPLREYTVVAVLANEVLRNKLNATIVPGDSSAVMHEGAPLDPDGGTLVYNPRGKGDPAQFQGPLHDPTAILYVLAGDLEPVNPKARACENQSDLPGVANPECAVQLKDGAGVEPLVLRAAAGDCVEATLYSRLPKVMPDLAGYNTLLQVVRRDRDDRQGMTTFQNNLIRPSSHVGLHAQLVEYDVSQHDGANVGTNRVQTVGPVTKDGKADEAITYRWYAGHLETVSVRGNKVRLDPTPVEFGGSNLNPADKVKQGQKGLVGALIIEPEGSIWKVDSGTRLAADVGPDANADGVPDRVGFRDFALVHQKGLNHRFGDGTAVENIASEGQGIPEDSHDAGQAAINYGSEPLWFRFGLPPDAPFGNAGAAGSLGGVANPELAYSNALAGGDPATAVFNAEPGQEVRMRVLEPTGVGRGSTIAVHGHSWQRDPYICPDSSDLGLAGKCAPGELGSTAIGDNPLGIELGHQESVTPAAHFDLLLPRAGGAFGVEGDYLFRDQASFGNLNGLWGILRVAPLSEPEAVAQQ